MIFAGALKKLIYCIITVGSISILSYLERHPSEIFSEIYLLEQQHKLFIQEIEQWLQVITDAHLAALKEISEKKELQNLERAQSSWKSWKHWINIIPQIVDQTADLRHQTADYLHQTADFIGNHKKIIISIAILGVIIYCGYSIYNMDDKVLYPLTYLGDAATTGLQIVTATIPDRFEDVPTIYEFLIPIILQNVL
jgi:hypothetical protein